MIEMRNQYNLSISKLIQTAVTTVQYMDSQIIEYCESVRGHIDILIIQ